MARSLRERAIERNIVSQLGAELQRMFPFRPSPRSGVRAIVIVLGESAWLSAYHRVAGNVHGGKSHSAIALGIHSQQTEFGDRLFTADGLKAVHRLAVLNAI